MVALQVHSFQIKSSINNYEVFFNKNISEVLKQEALKGDIIIIDNNTNKIPIYKIFSSSLINKVIAIR